MPRRHRPIFIPPSRWRLALRRVVAGLLILLALVVLALLLAMVAG